MTTIKTLRYHKDSINKALTHKYSNRKLERTNNLIIVKSGEQSNYIKFEISKT